MDLACLADEPVSAATMNSLSQVTSRLAVVPHAGNKRYLRCVRSLLAGRTATEGLFDSDDLGTILREWDRQEQFGAMMASSSGVARYLFPPYIRQEAPRWVDLTDVDSQKWIDYAQAARFPMSLIYRIEGQRLRQVEQHLADSCEQLLVVSEAERRLFQSFCPTDRVATVGNGVDSDYFAPSDSVVAEASSCVFVGVMNYKPNVDAVIWFANQVWPRVRQQFPDAVFRIVGKSPAAEVKSLTSKPGIEVIGPVPDVRPWLYRSACAVVPLQIARGVQNKVLEAMSCGRPVICSSSPLKGLAAEPGLHLLRADSVEEWLNAISRVFQDPILRQELGMAAAAFVLRHHSWDECLSSLDQIVEHRKSAARKISEVAK